MIDTYKGQIFIDSYKWAPQCIIPFLHGFSLKLKWCRFN